MTLQLLLLASNYSLFGKVIPALWFLQFEAQFALAGITADDTKLNRVISAVDSEILNSVYLIQSIKLIQYHPTLLGDQRPSQSLTCMRALAGDTVGESLLKSPWLGRLPNGTQTILTALSEDMAGLASVADKIIDLTNHSNINAVHVTPSTSDARVTQLEQQISQLTILAKYTKNDSPTSGISILLGDSEFYGILSQFLDPSQPTKNNKPTKIRHFIETTGQPVFSRPRRLSPQLLKIARQEFEFLMSQGIVRPSSSPRASREDAQPSTHGEKV
ncbi:hypothetical protein AVEN_11285-1 [Araneus ventricosus]|uniref:DUF7041 domain-containing protein n=1 Tax=Araneus ventricosus TaxID=182803 RepID=A0A4Y2IUA7_ARAVE|nr:hypothetical protein AVEN_11285-1 [Araneus ventricosus]